MSTPNSLTIPSPHPSSLTTSSLSKSRLQGDSGWQEGLNEGAKTCSASQIWIPSRKAGGRREAFQAERRAHAKVWKQETVRRPFCLKKWVSKGQQRSWGGRSLLIRGSAGMGSRQGFGVRRVQQAETVLLSNFARDWLCILGQAASWDFLPSVSITLIPAFFQPAFGDQISTAWYQVHVSRLFFHRFEVSDQMMLP